MTTECGLRAKWSISSIVMASILLYTYKQVTYLRLPLMTSMSWSVVTSSRTSNSTLCNLYSCKICCAVLTGSSPSLVRGTVALNLTPPVFFLTSVTFGGRLLSRMPTVSNSRSRMTRWLLTPSLAASRTISTKSAVLATAMTSRPRPLPIAAPWMIPGKSRSWMRTSLYKTLPGMHVSVVNSYPAASDSVSVSAESSDDFPTDGNPMSATRPSPDLDTAKPSPPPPPPPFWP
mmetsp:Transcript_9635/g.39284  ORF Transcript_9635/g.39284 Transcript_9635/m.39284 type:complete len:232 (+) Transcript_9635:651-1346(+)